MKLQFETLENRCLLTAVAHQVDDVLTIEGENRAESVIVTQLDADSFQVRRDVDTETFDGVSKIEVDLAGRADILKVRGLNVSGLSELDVDMGKGRDYLQTKRLDVESLVVDMGLGSDSLLLFNSKFDTIDLFGNNGDDQLTLENSEVNSLTVDGGLGGNIVNLYSSTVGVTNIDLSEGTAGFVNVDFVHFLQNVSINTSVGDDYVRLLDSAFDGEVDVLLGAGDFDGLDIAHSVFNGDVLFDGGDGSSDELLETDNQYNAGKTVLNFEL